MESSLQFLFGFVSIAIALTLRPLSKKLLIPYPLILVIIGFVISEIIVSLGYDTGIRHYHFGPVNLNVFIPAIIFSVSFSIPPKYLLSNAIPIFLLGFPVLLLSLFITAILFFYGIGHSTGFPWIAAFITAAVVSSISARGVLELLQELKVPKRLTVLIEGESLFSDIVAIILFGFFVTIATKTQLHSSTGYWIIKLIWDVIGSLIVGHIIGFIVYITLKLIKDHITQAVITVCGVYISFLVAEHLLHVAGAVSVFCVGQLTRLYYQKHPNEFISKLWDLNLLLATMGVFLLLGVTITIEMFSARWLAMIIGIAGVLIARSIGVYGCLSFLSFTKITQPFNFEEQTIVNLSGVRGALSIALAFSLPEKLDYWWTIQSIAFGVVLFTLLFQAPLISWLMTRTEWLKRLRA